MSEITVSAPGKVILHGEHAVVYGKKAVAAAINVRTFLKLTPNLKNKVAVKLPDVNLSGEWNVDDLRGTLKTSSLSSCDSPDIIEETVASIKRFVGIDDDVSSTQQLAVVAFLYLYTGITNKSLPPLDIIVRSQLATGAGLGSSAAFSTSLAASLLLYTKQVENGSEKLSNLKLVNQWAFQAEKIIHGRPSGIDNSVSTFGGAVILQNGQLSFLDTIPQLRVLLVNTKVPRSTKVLVAGVREKYNKYTAIIAPILDAIEAISDKSIEVYGGMNAAGDGDIRSTYVMIKDLIEMNQKLLELLGVSHPSIERIVGLAKSFGLCSKLTGAGGGGCVFAVVPPNIQESAVTKMKEELEKIGYDCWETSIGAEGVRSHVETNFDSLVDKK